MCGHIDTQHSHILFLHGISSLGYFSAQWCSYFRVNSTRNHCVVRFPFHRASILRCDPTILSGDHCAGTTPPTAATRTAVLRRVHFTRPTPNSFSAALWRDPLSGNYSATFPSLRRPSLPLFQIHFSWLPTIPLPIQAQQ